MSIFFRWRHCEELDIKSLINSPPQPMTDHPAMPTKVRQQSSRRTRARVRAHCGAQTGAARAASQPGPRPSFRGGQLNQSLQDPDMAGRGAGKGPRRKPPTTDQQRQRMAALLAAGNAHALVAREADVTRAAVRHFALVGGKTSRPGPTPSFTSYFPPFARWPGLPFPWLTLPSMRSAVKTSEKQNQDEQVEESERVRFRTQARQRSGIAPQCAAEKTTCTGAVQPPRQRPSQFAAEKTACTGAVQPPRKRPPQYAVEKTACTTGLRPPHERLHTLHTREEQQRTRKREKKRVKERTGGRQVAQKWDGRTSSSTTGDGKRARRGLRRR